MQEGLHSPPRLTAVPDLREESWDERVIRKGIEAAEGEQRPLDSRTVRCIAAQLHGGQTSPLYALASCGAIVEGLDDELARLASCLPEIGPWAENLAAYVQSRDDHGPVEGWAEHAAQLDRLDQDDETLDSLFGTTPDEQIGSVDEDGWFAIVRLPFEPGGVLLCQNDLGFRNFVRVTSDEELAVLWDEVQGRYAEYYDEVDGE